MISENSVKIIKDICALISHSGGDCAEWRIGVAANVERELFDTHGVARNYPWQICRRALSHKEAVDIVEGFRNLSCEAVQPRKRTDNEPELYVYAYLKEGAAKSVPRSRAGANGFSTRPASPG